MRRTWKIIILILLLGIGGGGAWLLLRQPKPQIISLPDGSKLTLLKVTYGTNHVCRYQTGWQELVYPLLPKNLKANLSPRLIQFATASDTLMVWFRHDGTSANSGWPPPFFLSVLDANGLESDLRHSAGVTRPLNSGKAAVAGTLPAPPAGQISGWDLAAIPRRSKQFNIRIYCQEAGGNVPLAGEFRIENPGPRKFPEWLAETLPATRQTNGLEISLAKLETGLTGKEVGSGPSGAGAKSFSRATFRLKENGTPTEKWNVCRIRASNATGEVHSGGYSSRWWQGTHTIDFEDGLWLEETAWKLEVDFARSAEFPPDELWVIERVRVPQPGELVEAQQTVTRANRELEFRGISGPNAKLPSGYASHQPHANVHLRSPHPMEELRIVLVEVRDDRGQKARLQGYSSTTSTVARGATPKQVFYGFAFDIPDGAATLDITLAVTGVRHGQFVAKPVLYVPPAKPGK